MPDYNYYLVEDTFTESDNRAVGGSRRKLKEEFINKESLIFLRCLALQTVGGFDNFGAVSPIVCLSKEVNI